MPTHQAKSHPNLHRTPAGDTEHTSNRDAANRQMEFLILYGILKPNKVCMETGGLIFFL